MNTNVLNEALELLGLVNGEEFKLKEHPNYTFKINEMGLLYKGEDVDWTPAENIAVDFFSLIMGEFTIIKAEFEPTYGRIYYHPKATDWTRYTQEVWSDSPADFAYKAAGMAFNTAAECEYALRTLAGKFVTEN